MVTAVRVESLSINEAQALIGQAYSDGLYAAYGHYSTDNVEIHEAGQLAVEARGFYKAWIHHTGNSVEAMLWALNNEALPYRLHLISLLVGMRLHDTP